MFKIVSRYLVAGEGWKRDETSRDTLEAAYYAASTIAVQLDRTFGGDHFWTVDVTSEYGSYIQLFHGRLS